MLWLSNPGAGPGPQSEIVETADSSQPFEVIITYPSGARVREPVATRAEARRRANQWRRMWRAAHRDQAFGRFLRALLLPAWIADAVDPRTPPPAPDFIAAPASRQCRRLMEVSSESSP